MITAVVDTNVLLRGAISGSRRSPSKDLVDAFFAGRFLLFLVTKDNRHLLRLKQYHQTRIVTPAQFLRELP